jgi:hypothetical protein
MADFAHLEGTNASCRGCNSFTLVETLDLGILASAGRFVKKNQSVDEDRLCLASCSECGLTQLSSKISVSNLYVRGYGYESSLNSSMVAHLQNKARTLEDRYLKGNDRIIVDIASNDGTLLSGYLNPTSKIIGIDPLISAFNDKYPTNATKIESFFTAKAYFEKVKKPADLVTSCSVLYDSDDPRNFVNDVAKILAPGGIWHSEQSYLPTMVSNLSYDTICHEHLLYLRLTDIKNWCADSKLDLISVEFNDINGGSFAFTAQKCYPGEGVVKLPSQINQILENEISAGFDHTLVALRDFETAVESHIRAFRMEIEKIKSKGFEIYGLGASTKGNILLQTIGLTSREIVAIGDVNPKKHGLFTPKTGIPIISEESMVLLAKEDAVFIVLPWHFKRSIVQSLKHKYPNRRFKLLFPLPAVEYIEVI